MSRLFSEVRTDYMFGALVDGKTAADWEGHMATVTIDAWTAGREEGEVVAQVIMSEHGDIIVAWHNNGARLDEDVLDAIADAKRQLKDLAESVKDQYPDLYAEVLKHV